LNPKDIYNFYIVSPIKKNIKISSCFLYQKGIYKLEFDSSEEAVKLLEIGNVLISDRRVVIKLSIL